MTVRRKATPPRGRQARLLPQTSSVSSWVLGAILLAGALVRFGTLGHQSLWFDEALTHNLVIQPFNRMLTIVADTENTPPLFYVLTSAVTDLVGTGEVGLRLVSALSGTATIGVAFLGGRELSGDRAGLVAAGLVATNPMLVWFSQEARSYALVILLTAIALIARRQSRRGRGPPPGLRLSGGTGAGGPAVRQLVVLGVAVKGPAGVALSRRGLPHPPRRRPDSSSSPPGQAPPTPCSATGRPRRGSSLRRASATAA